MSMQHVWLWTTALAVSLVSSAANAHHSQTFFQAEITEFSGELLDLRWRNPHVTMAMSINNSDSGEPERWEFEFDSIYVLQRMGVSSDDFPIGEQVRVAARASNLSLRSGLALNLLRADGQEILLFARSSPHFSDQVIGIAYGSDNERSVVDAAAQDRGIFRVWSSPALGYHNVHQPLTEEAIAARAQFDLADNFATRCEPEGMPRLMRNPHPFEFVEEPSKILIHSELYGVVRTVHMDAISEANDVSASPLGYSTGRWDGNTLIVATQQINWPYFDNTGTPQSDQVEILERFTLSDDQSRLSYHATVTDPATFTEPATIEGYWLALGESLEPFSCVAY